MGNLAEGGEHTASQDRESRSPGQTNLLLASHPGGCGALERAQFFRASGHGPQRPSSRYWQWIT